MALNDVYVFRTVNYYKSIHIEPTFDARSNCFDYWVYF